MLANYLKTSLFLIAILFFVSCDRDMNCIDLDAECQRSCQLVPEIPWCGTGAEIKYYFNPTTQQCEAYPEVGYGGEIPFETLEECESCGCDEY